MSDQLSIDDLLRPNEPGPEAGPEPEPVRRRPRRGARAVAWIIPLALMLAAGGYVAFSANVSLPAPALEVMADTASEAAASNSAPQELVEAQLLPTAIGWFHGSDEEVWTNDEAAYPLGSITKLIMMLVAFEYMPLDPGAEGETYVWTAADAALTAKYQAVDGVSYNIPVGTAMTQRDMMKLIFLPSANDVAHAYALWVFGSNDAFLAALDSWKAEHGLDSISLIEPTGMEVADVATAADIVRVTRLALQNPTIAEFNAMEYAEMPWGIGTVVNSNPLLGIVPGVVGTKTGTIYSSYNLTAAQTMSVDGREVINISVTLDRPSQSARAGAGAAVLQAMSELPVSRTLVEEGEVIGTLRAVTGETIELVANESVTALLLPGETASRTVELDSGWGGWDAKPEGAGTITVATPAGEITVPVHATGTLTEPDLWWRLTHPREVLG